MNIRNMIEIDIDNVSELFIEQVLHIKNLNDCYCDNEACIKQEELFEKFKKYLWEFYSNPDALIIVAEDNNQIIGFIIGVIIPCRVPTFISKVKKVGYIEEAHVITAYRRKGILRKMEKLLLSFFREHDIQHVELNYFTANNIGKKSWELLGYRTYMEYGRKLI